MIEVIVIVSLIITGLHIAFAAGNFLSPVRVFVANYLDKGFGQKVSKYIQKPLWDCLPCMGSVWTLIITWHFDLWLIAAVCGLNTIIGRLIEKDEVVLEEVKGVERVTEYHDEVPTISRQKVNV